MSEEENSLDGSPQSPSSDEQSYSSSSDTNSSDDSEGSSSKSSKSNNSSKSPKSKSHSKSKRISTSSSDSESSDGIDINDIKGTTSEILKEPFLICNKSSHSIKALNDRIKESNLYKYITDRNYTYEDYKKQLSTVLTKTCKFQHELFERVVAYIRLILNDADLAHLNKADVSNFHDFFMNLNEPERLDIATIIDLMEAGPGCSRFLLWIARNMCYGILETNKYGFDEKYKCICYGQRRTFFGKKPEYYWAVLHNDNKFTLHPVNNSNKTKKTVQTDIISLSRSGKSVKILSNPSKIDVIVVPPEGYDRELWLSKAVRSDEVPFYPSLPYFMKPMPIFYLDACKRALSTNDMLVLRSILQENILDPNNCQPILKKLLSFYTTIDSINGFFSTIAMLDVFAHGAREDTFLRKSSYLSGLIDVVIREYCQDYFNSIVAPLLIRIDRGPMVFTGAADANKANSIIGEVINTITLSADKVPMQMRHLISLIYLFSGVRYGTMRGAVSAASEAFFVRFIVQMMERGESIFRDFHPVTNHEQFLANLGKAMVPIFRMANFDQEYSGLMELNDQLEPYRMKIYNFIQDIIRIPISPSYPSPDEKTQMNDLNDILEFISTKRPQFIANTKSEALSLLKSPLAGEFMQFIYAIATN